MDKDKLLRQYLDGELTPEEEQKALHEIADDPEMRSMLRFEHTLSSSLARGAQIKSEQLVPEGFTDNVMHRIEQQEGELEAKGFAEKLTSWYKQLWIPKQFQWRPVYAFAAAILVFISFTYPLFLANDWQQTQQADMVSSQKPGGSVQQVSSTGDQVMLRFVYIGNDAESVAVAGDFSDWEPIEMTRQTVNGEDVWTGLVSMNRGEHRYMFVKNDSQWITDPLATVQRDDGFGNKNAVIYL